MDSPVVWDSAITDERRAVPCEVPDIKRNIVDGWQEPAGSCGRDAGA
jgi:hypothetical protein